MMTKDISTVKLDFKTKIAVLSAILHSTRSEGTSVEQTVLEAIEIDRETNVQCNKIISKSKAQVSERLTRRQEELAEKRDALAWVKRDAFKAGLLRAAEIANKHVLAAENAEIKYTAQILEGEIRSEAAKIEGAEKRDFLIRNDKTA